MTTKEKLLELFEAGRGEYFSGEDIARRFSLSRTAVWKAVKALKEEGYAISAVTNKGYCLSEQTDILSAQGIQKYLRPEIAGMDISVLPEAASTNTIVREMANAGRGEGFAVLANSQTAGRGRFGRSFFSPEDTGVYMSLLLRPENYTAEQAVRITTMAAVAMCEAIEAVSEEEAAIKWVNDIFVRGRKVCGILTEGAFDIESGMMEYSVLGLGVNVYEPEEGFPKALRDVAGAVFQTRRSDVKNRLASEFLNRFYGYYKAEDKAGYVEKYRRRSFVIGRTVTVASANQKKSAVVLGIDDKCRLIVKYGDGKVARCSSGEISICV